MSTIQKYTVILLFNKDGSKILLQKKNRTIFAGKLNGVGGKVEADETPLQGAYREMFEETSLRPKDVKPLRWLGTLTKSEQCEGPKGPKLWFYAGVVENETRVCVPDTETEGVAWYKIGKNQEVFTTLDLAGDGDLEYFIGRARTMLFDK